MDSSDVKHIAHAYVRALSKDRETRLRHSQLESEFELAQFINDTVEPLTPLTVGDLPAFREYLYQPEERTRRFQETIRGLGREDGGGISYGVGKGAEGRRGDE